MKALFLILSSTSCLFANFIAPDEADEDLPPAQEVISEFLAKGGMIVRLENDTPPFPLASGDRVFPACSGGNNRSQTLWNVLRPYAGQIDLMPPHATRYGFDPYNGRANWQRTFHTYDRDEFFLWAGVGKAQKFGWDLFGCLLHEERVASESLAEMRAYYDRFYYSCETTPDIRKVYITFAKNGHTHLYRLNEVNRSLQNVVVLLFPLEDLIYTPLPEWNTYPYSIKSYCELAAILRSYLDCAQLSEN